jgi:tellurite resistance protein
MLAPESVVNEPRIVALADAIRSAPSATAPEGPARSSIVALAAASYGARTPEDVTVPTGFDPAAVALFETIVEGAYLVANADGAFDDQERRVFERMVVEACGGTVTSQQIAALLCDLHSQLRAGGIDRRIESVAASVSKREHAKEVLRVAALMAQASHGVSEIERAVVAKLGARCGLDGSDVDEALADATAALRAAESEAGS